MPDAPWKRFERWVAKVTQGRRTGNVGLDTADVQHEWLAPECKYRGKLPKWLKEAMDQAERNARGERLPCVWLTEKHARYWNSLVIMRAHEFVGRFVEDNDGGHTGCATGDDSD